MAVFDFSSEVHNHYGGPPPSPTGPAARPLRERLQRAAVYGAVCFTGGFISGAAACNAVSGDSGDEPAEQRPEPAVTSTSPAPAPEIPLSLGTHPQEHTLARQEITPVDASATVPVHYADGKPLGLTTHDPVAPGHISFARERVLAAAGSTRAGHNPRTTTAGVRAACSSLTGPRT